MNKIQFWNKIAFYSTLICGVMLVIMLFFKKHIESIIFPFLAVGVIVLIISVASEIAKFIIKRRA